MQYGTKFLYLIGFFFLSAIVTQFLYQWNKQIIPKFLPSPVSYNSLQTNGTVIEQEHVAEKRRTKTNNSIIRNPTTKKLSTSKKVTTTKKPEKMTPKTKKQIKATETNKSKRKIISTTKMKTKKSKKKCIGGGFLPKIEVYKGGDPNVTVVTAYFNLGKFQKGRSESHDTALYLNWASGYKNLLNPVVFYTDSENFAKIFANVRSNHLNNTKIIRINRTELWSFRWLDRIRAIYSIKGYPKHHPNTVVPEYSCVQHSKHAVVEHAILKKHVTTKYVTWLDVGYFRYLVNRNKRFWIFKPRDFNDSRIAMNEVYEGVNMKIKPESIFKGNIVWIGGGMAFATTKVYLDFVQDYKHAVERYLKMSLMNTDQQVLYAMNLPEEKKTLKPKVDLQIYTPDVPVNCWFYLGYSCIRELP